MAALTKQLHLDLGVPEPSLYHAAEDTFGYFALLVRDRSWHERVMQYNIDGGMTPAKAANIPQLKQTMHKVSDIERVLSSLDRQRDTYISQSDFKLPRAANGAYGRPNRRIVNLHRTSVVFIDLDLRLSADQVEHFVDELLREIAHSHIPTPSLILFSGRGLHIKWVLRHALPPQALIRWNAVQQHIALWLHERDWCPDMGALDASRVLRIESTVNEKSGEVCRVVWADQDGFGDVVTHDFNALADAVLPMSREAYRAEQQRQYDARGAQWAAQRAAKLRLVAGGPSDASKIALVGSQRGLNTRKLWWDRMGDLRTLAALRGGVPHDQTAMRERMVFMAANAGIQAGVLHAENLFLEVRSLAAQMFPGAWSDRHRDRWPSHLSTLYHRAQAFGQGEANKLYQYKNDTLIQQLAITDGEMRDLKTIISGDEKRRRDREATEAKRREAGVIPRGKYEGDAAQLRERVGQLKAEGLKNSQIAEIIGVTKGRVTQILQKFNVCPYV